MLIRELEKNTGLERATIRFYEKEGLIAPVRHENGYREYSDADCDTLLKVKLLRQLGMPLDMIRGLQQGNENFTTAMTDQIHMLEHKIQDTARSKKVCIELRDSGTTYENLDAAYYLHELTRVQPAEPAWQPPAVPEFQQKPETHPWRRYFARSIDYAIINILEYFVLVVLLRIRPMNDFAYTFFGFAIITYLLWIPIEGLLLHYWGTTPGKWIMGIRVESANGENLTVSAAMQRAWGVLRYGYGFTVPIYSLWRSYRSYKDYVEYGYVQWDREQDAEIQFQYDYNTRKKLLIAAVAIFYVLLSVISLSDSVKPANRGENLTIAQIAQNHNDYLETLYDGQRPPAYFYLLDNGQWRKTQSNTAVITIGSKPVHSEANYEYEVENGYVRSIRYEQAWTEVSWLRPVGNYVQCTVFAVAGAQDWASYKTLSDFEDVLNEELKLMVGQLIYENLEIRWTTEIENCVIGTDGIYYTNDHTAPSMVRLNFELIIHPSN